MAHLINAAQALVVSLSLCFVWVMLRKRLTPHRLPLPPGPKGLPLLGSALEINKNEPWLTYTKWQKTYGEIVSCKLLGQTYVIINSERIANALLDQRSTIYSDRPVVRACTLFGMDFNTAHLHYGNTWKSQRKMFHQTLGSAMVPKYHDILTAKARDLLTNLLHSPGEFANHMRTYAASIIMSITYGYDVVQKDDPFVGPVEEITKILVLMTPERAVLLDIFPQLLFLNLPSWFPGAELRRLAERCKELSPKVRDSPFQFVKDCLSKNIENHSMVAQLLEDKTAAGQDHVAYEQNIKDSAMSMLIAGTESTQSALNTLILALILFPQVQDRAQAIIDKVVGKDRLPNFDDKASLQYIDALIFETLRWGSLVPMSIPHMVTRDDIFEQCLIPKGSVIIPNVWGMTRDESRFPDPEVFAPERHLDADGKLLPDDLSGIRYGYGRRICAGRHISHASLWLAAANMISMFRFSKAIGVTGYEIEIFPKFNPGVARIPVSFPCHIVPRFEEAKGLLSESPK